MKIKRLFIITSLLITSIFLFFLSFLIILPADLIITLVKEGLEEKTGLTFLIDDFQKAYPFGFRIKKLSILPSEKEAPILSIDTVSGKIDPFSPFLGKIRISVSGGVEEGEIQGEIILKIQSAVLDFKAKDISIPYLKTMKVDGGLFSGQWYTAFSEDRCPAGYIRIKGKNADATGINIMGISLGMIGQAGIDVDLSGTEQAADSVTRHELYGSACKFKLKGLWADGNPLLVKTYGEVYVKKPFKDSSLNLALEITPRVQFLKNNFLLELIRNYRKSANYYLINIRGTVGDPVLAQ